MSLQPIRDAKSSICDLAKIKIEQAVEEYAAYYSDMKYLDLEELASKTAVLGSVPKCLSGGEYILYQPERKVICTYHDWGVDRSILVDLYDLIEELVSGDIKSNKAMVADTMLSLLPYAGMLPATRDLLTSDNNLIRAISMLDITIETAKVLPIVGETIGAGFDVFLLTFKNYVKAAKTEKFMLALGGQRASRLSEFILSLFKEAGGIEEAKKVLKSMEALEALPAGEADNILNIYIKSGQKEAKELVTYLEIVADWKKVSQVGDINEFLRITEQWNSSRRGYAFERWIAFNKMKQAGIEELGALKPTFEKELYGLTKDRVPDRLKETAGRIWDFKNYKPNTIIDGDQLNNYLEILKKTDNKSIVYLFSTENSARKNLSVFQKVLQQLPDGKSIQVLYIGTDNKIHRLEKIIMNQ
ncbi:MAG: hypothetical protein M1503_00730 [Thaumarchaeota archaeon]|nr:hypothetical protein [Nitrososphaerota archaeon]MCL5316778.1 hypothetical protein [Nitrososphaerota archaeon]